MGFILAEISTTLVVYPAVDYYPLTMKRKPEFTFKTLTVFIVENFYLSILTLTQAAFGATGINDFGRSPSELKPRFTTPL